MPNVGAISVHGTVGIFGIFAVLLSDPDATFGGQLIGMLTIFIWVFVASSIVWLILKSTVGIRVSEEDEYEGLTEREIVLAKRLAQIKRSQGMRTRSRMMSESFA